MCLLGVSDIIDHASEGFPECYSFKVNSMDIGWLKGTNHPVESIEYLIGETILSQIRWEMDRLSKDK